MNESGVRAVCLMTDSREPSGVGSHMLTLAAELRGQYELLFACPSGPAGDRLLTHARALGLATFALDGDRRDGDIRLRDWLRAAGTAIAHVHAGIGWEGHDLVMAARRAGVPAVLRTEHLPQLITDPAQWETYRRMLPAVDRILCVSEGVCASYLRAGVPAAKLRTVRNGLRPCPPRRERAGIRQRLGLPAAAPVLLTVGRLTEQKGHHDLIAAMPAVLASVPDAVVLCAGDGPLAGDLRALVRALGLEERAHLLGQRDDVPDLLTAADAFVLPSLFEGLPLAALEAMAAGLPVVGTRVCGTSEVVVDGVTGRLVAPRDSPALAGALVEVLSDPGRATRWGQCGRQRVVEEFSAARMAAETVAVYAEALDGPAAPGSAHHGLAGGGTGMISPACLAAPLPPPPTAPAGDMPRPRADGDGQDVMTIPRCRREESE